jgi:hypothetical protein
MAYDAFWIDFEILRSEFFVLKEIDILRLVSDVLLGQGDEYLLSADGIEVTVYPLK